MTRLISDKLVKFAYDKDSHVQMAKETYQIFKNAYDNQKRPLRFTEEDFIKSAQDDKRIERYLRAQEILERQNKSHSLAKQYEDAGLYSGKIEKGLVRHAELILDTSGTPEADEKNIAFLKKASTKDGAQEILNEEIRNLMKFDVSKLYTSDPDEVTELMDKHYNEMQFLFVFKSEIDNGQITLDADCAEFLKTNGAMFEQAGFVRTQLGYMAANLYLTAPDNMTEDDVFPCYSDLLQDCVKRRNDGVPGYAPFDPTRPQAEFNTESYLNRVLEGSNYIASNLGAQTLKEKGILDSDFIFKYKGVDSLGNEMLTDEAIKAYGNEVLNYNSLPMVQRQDLTLDDYLKSVGADKMFVSRGTEYEKVKNIIASGDIVISDEKVYDSAKDMFDGVNKTVDEMKGTRSYNRINSIKSLINDIYDDKKEIDGHKLQDKTKHILANQARKMLVDKHESRTGLWKFFHPFQNRAERNAIEDIDAMLVGKGFNFQIANTYDGRFNEIKESAEGSLARKEQEKLANENILTENKEKGLENQPIKEENLIRSQEDLSNSLNDLFLNNDNGRTSPEVKGPSIADPFKKIEK